MRRFAYISCAVYAVVIGLFVFRQTFLLQSVSMLLFLALVVSFVFSIVHIFRRWSLLRWRVFFPLAACLAAFFLAPRIGGAVRDMYFRRQIPRLEVAVQSYISTGHMPQVQWSGVLIAPHTFEDGSVAVDFLWGTGFPVKHTSLVYFSAGDAKPYLEKKIWYYGYRFQDHWWIMED